MKHLRNHVNVMNDDIIEILAADGSLSPNRINLTTRTIFIYGWVDEQLSVAISDCIAEMDKLRDKPITIKINSHGGSLYDTQAIIAELWQCQNKINIDIIGCAFSGAAMIALAGDFCRMSELSNVMLHYPNWETENVSLQQHKVDMTVLEEYFCRLMRACLERTKFKFEDFIKEVKKGDIFLTPKKCLKLGLIEEIY